MWTYWLLFAIFISFCYLSQGEGVQIKPGARGLGIREETKDGRKIAGVPGQGVPGQGVPGQGVTGLKPEENPILNQRNYQGAAVKTDGESKGPKIHQKPDFGLQNTGRAQQGVPSAKPNQNPSSNKGEIKPSGIYQGGAVITNAESKGPKIHQDPDFGLQTTGRAQGYPSSKPNQNPTSDQHTEEHQPLENRLLFHPFGHDEPGVFNPLKSPNTPGSPFTGSLHLRANKLMSVLQTTSPNEKPFGSNHLLFHREKLKSQVDLGTLKVPGMYVCTRACLAHRLCFSAAYNEQRSTCDLKGQKVMTPRRIFLLNKIRIYSVGGPPQAYTVPRKDLMDVIGVCSIRPCSSNTFCHKSSSNGFDCLLSDQFLQRIQNSTSVHKNGVKGSANGLRRKKRSLNTSRRDLLGLNKKGKPAPHPKTSCGIPPKWPNALALYTGTLAGDSATYYCEDGHHTSTKSTKIVCRDDGYWSRPNFKCVPRLPCGAPHDIPGSIMHFYEVNNLRKIKYVCKTDPMKYQESTCYAKGGSWSPVNLQCNDPQKKKTSKKSQKNSQKLDKKNLHVEAEIMAPRGAGHTGVKPKPASLNRKTQKPKGPKTAPKTVIPVKTANKINAKNYNKNSSLSKRQGEFEYDPVATTAAPQIVEAGGAEDIEAENNTEPQSTSGGSQNATAEKTQNATRKIVPKTVNGVIRADVNSELGIPGVKCGPPGQLAYAHPLFGSTQVGSKINYQCAKYFTDSSPKPHCPVITCLFDGIWSELLLSCSSHIDCLRPTNSYDGKRTCSNSGYQCKKWADVFTDPKVIKDLEFPEGDIREAKNYCRDPLKQGTPWCFTTDPSVIWDYCSVPLC